MTYYPESERDPPNNPIMLPTEKPMTTLAERLRELLHRRKTEPTRLMRGDHPEALNVAVARAGAIDRSIAELVEEHADRLLAALSPSPAPWVDGERDEQAQRLQDHMEQHHGVCLKASEWDAAIASLSTEGVKEREALEWYRERAKSLAEKDWQSNPDYAMAIFTELSLDGGGRADKALGRANHAGGGNG